MAYDKAAGAPDVAATPSSTQDKDKSVSKKKDKKNNKTDKDNPDRGSGDETSSFWIKVGAARGL